MASNKSNCIVMIQGLTGITQWLLAVCLLCVAGLGQAQSEFPTLSGQIVDQAGLLDESTESTLLTQLEAHEQETGNQLVIATISSLDGYDIADYANRLGRFWKIGTAEDDNGVLLVVAPNERKVRIEVGYGLEGALTDALSSIIIQREILPPFRNGDYSLGIRQGVVAILQAIKGEYVADNNAGTGRKSNSLSNKIGNYLPLVFIAMFGVPHLIALVGVSSQLQRRKGYKQAVIGAIPAGFSGLFVGLGSGNLLIGLAVAIVIFIFIYLTGSGKGGGGSGGNASRQNRGYSGSGGFGSSRGGGGFSGGGGSFGGGGASGSW